MIKDAKFTEKKHIDAKPESEFKMDAKRCKQITKKQKKMQKNHKDAKNANKS